MADMAAVVGLVVLGVLAALLCILYIRSEIAARRTTTPREKELTAQLEATREQLYAIRQEHAIEIGKVLNEKDAEFVELQHRMELHYENRRRADMKASNARSRSALVAKISEHMSPLLGDFPYSHKEVRHVGEVFDFLVYKGLEDGRIEEVIFLEVKTRRTGRVSNPREKMLRDAIQRGAVRYEVYVPQLIRRAIDGYYSDYAGAKENSDVDAEDL